MGLFESRPPGVQKALDVALKSLSYRPRSVLEIRRHLAKKGVDNEIIKLTVKTLEQDGYLDDGAYAQRYAESRAAQSPRSIFAIAYELKQKGICQDLIEKALADFDDDTLALAAAQTKARQLKHLDPETVKKKLFNFLRYRGFGYSVCQKTWEEIHSQGPDNHDKKSGF